MSIVEKLTEGIVRRDLAKEGAALMNKWERTGLLEGLDSEHAKITWLLFLRTKQRNCFVRLL